MNIAIIGAGNGGLALGTSLLKQGVTVSLFDKFPEIINPIIENNNFVSLKRNGEQNILQFSLVTCDLKEAINDAQYILIVTPAFAHKEIAKDLSKLVKSDQILILCPGRTGGALEVKKIMEDAGKSEVVVAETETLLYACRKSSDTSVCIYGIKRKVGVASIPDTSIDTILQDLNKYIPNFFPYPNVFFTSLNNVGAIFHPTPFLLNIGKIERGERFKYYHEGISPFIASFLERLDEERITIGRKFSINLQSAKEWLEERYVLEGDNLYDVIQKNDNYKDIFAPTETKSRYVLEDIPMSLYPLTELARLVSVETPLMNSIIDLASVLYKKDFRVEGRRLTDMGIINNCEQIGQLINNRSSIS